MTVLEFLQEHNVPLAPEGHHHVSANWYGLDCPYCSPDSGRFRMGIPRSNPRIASCWTCGGHSLVKTLVLLTGEKYETVKKLLDNHTPERREERKRGRLQLPSGLGPLLSIHRRYLKGRGFDPDAMEKLWKVQGIGLATNLAWRLFLPCHYQGEIVSWTTRAVVDNVKARYINAKPEQEAISLKHLLFGEDLVRHTVIVTEGPLDAVRLGPGAVATCGVNVTPTQEERIAKFPIRIIAFDSEPTAQRRAKQLADNVSVFSGKTRILQIDATDPGSLSMRDVRRIRREFLGGE